MTTIKKSLDETITRMVRETLADRARSIGSHRERPDSLAALAALIEQRLPAGGEREAAEAARAAASAGFGSVAVPAGLAGAALAALGDSRTHVTAVWPRTADPALASQALDDGAHELEIVVEAAALAEPALLDRALDGWRERCAAAKARLLLHVPGTLPIYTRQQICDWLGGGQRADALVLESAADIATIRALLGPRPGLHAATPASAFREARELLGAGANRISTERGLELLADARAASSAQTHGGAD